MNYKSTLVLILLVLSAGAYFWFVDRDKLSTYEKRLVENRLFESFDIDGIKQIEIDSTVRENETGKVANVSHYELCNEPSGWILTKPISYPVEDLKIRQLLDKFKKLEQSQVIEGEAYDKLDRALIGLDDPDVVATFYSQSTSVTFRIGRKNVVGWEAYLEIEGQPRAYLIPSRFKDDLQLSLDSDKNDLRSTKIFDARKYEISQIEIEHSGTPMTLKRSDNLTWEMISPLKDIANKEVVDNLIESIVNFKSVAFVQGSNYFDEPALTITLSQGLNKQVLEISPAIYSTNPNFEVSSVYMGRNTKYDQLFIINPKFILPFIDPVDKYRDTKLVVKGELEEPEKLVQITDNGTLEFLYKNSFWQIRDCLSSFENEIIIEDYVFNWTEIDIVDFVPAEKALKYMTNQWVELKFNLTCVAETRSIKISRPVGKYVYAERSPGVYVSLLLADIKVILMDHLWDFFSKDVIDLPVPFISEVDIMKEEVARQYCKSSNGWVVITKKQIGNSVTPIGPFLEDILPISARKFIAKAPKNQLAQYGLDQNTYNISFKTFNKQTVSLKIGSKTSKGYNAKLESEPYIFEISDHTYKSLNRFLAFKINQ